MNRIFHLTSLMPDICFAADAETGAAEPETKAKKPARTKQNDITLPAEGSKTRRVWDIADELSKAHKRPALRGEVLERTRKEGMSDGTAGTQYGRWMAYHGLTAEQLSEVRDGLRKAEQEAKAAAKAEKEEAAAKAEAEKTE